MATKLCTKARISAPIGCRRPQPRTFSLAPVFEEQTRCFAKADRSERRRNGSSSWSEVLLGLVNVVNPLASAFDVLGVQWADDIPPWTDAKNQRVLAR